MVSRTGVEGFSPEKLRDLVNLGFLLACCSLPTIVFLSSLKLLSWAAVIMTLLDWGAK